MKKYIDALFGGHRDAYTVLKGQTTALDAGDTAVVVTENDSIQLFLPENCEMTDIQLSLVEIFNALSRDKAGTVDKNGNPIAVNLEYAGFTQPFIDKMKGRASG